MTHEHHETNKAAQPQKLPPEVISTLKGWGLGTSDPLIRSAHNTAKCQNLKTGEIVAALGMAELAEVEALMAKKPPSAKALDWLREQGIKQLSTRLDEILSVQNGVAYLDSGFPELTVLPKAVADEGAFYRKHQNELNQRSLIPMQCNGELLLMFANFDKCAQFRGLGKKERIDSPLITELARLLKKQPDQAVFKTAVATGSLYHSAQDTISSTEGARTGDDGTQTIHYSEADETLIMGRLVSIISDAISQDVNDVAITPDYQTFGARIEHRINQEMVATSITLTRDEREALVNTLVARSRANPSGGRVSHPLDGNLNFIGRNGDAFLRLSFIPLEESRMPAVSVSIRILPKTTSTIKLSTLGITKEVEEELKYFMQLRDGLFVVAGPTGSGKSTTIGGLLCEHNEMFGDKRKRLSVEQPVERILAGVKHIDVEQHLYRARNGESTKIDKFAMALRALLRHDPDVIFVGEVRDQASCLVTIDAANTGHLVMTTTHANDTVLAYRRLASFLDKERQFDLVNVLSGILAQRLVQLVCKKCSTMADVTDSDRETLRKYSANKGVDLSGKVFDKKRVPNRSAENKCPHCKGGIAAMTGIHGLLVMSPEVRSLLLSNDESDWMKAQQVGSKVSLFDSAYSLYEQGLIELESVLI